MTATTTAKMADGANRVSLSWFNGWTIGTVLVAMIAVLPIAAVVYISMTPSDDIWQHLVDTVLGLYISTTLYLMIGVGLGTLVIGVSTAWLVSM
ncbi:MAG: iron ABC transporter permease, partial [Rhodospirillaceae bacterium]|nr:iron ABC transporter permease [Rhodospirillaceae bacterium]